MENRNQKQNQKTNQQQNQQNQNNRRAGGFHNLACQIVSQCRDQLGIGFVAFCAGRDQSGD